MTTKPTGGYVLEIDEMDITFEKLKVHVKKNFPGKACSTIQVLTQPFHLVSIDRTEKPVEFLSDIVTHDCID